MLRALILLAIFHFFSIYCFANEKSTKGLLPEISLKNNESENERRALSSEILISRSENKAITSLQALIKKKKGAAEEPELWHRLAELYMRRSKSGRFFDLHQDTALLKLSPFPVPNEKGAEAIRRASKIYNKIEADFPQFAQMDSVLFTNAFAHQQLGLLNVSEALYIKLLKAYPKTELFADGTLALGELLYNQGKFAEALEQFSKLEKYPHSRVYSYGMYKAAWAHYNLRESDSGIKKLVTVVKNNPALQDGEAPTNRHNLRREALRDLAIFIGDSYEAEKLYDFFEGFTTKLELGQAMMDLANLYDSHSRQKEINIFLNEYLKKQPMGSDVVNAHLTLIDANETLKNRDKVIEHLGQTNNLCQKDSTWRRAQSIDFASRICEETYRAARLDIAKKWWEIWLKNKQNLIFANLTQQVFRLILDNEDPSQPDLKARVAYAELLFQLEKYDEASTQYKLVGLNSKDPIISHDANYGALYSKEKSIEKNKNPLSEIERKELAVNYLTRHPQGKYANQVKFKLGHISYEEENFAEAEKILVPLSLLTGEGNLEIKRKSEDLILDIYNIRKDFLAIKNFAKKILSTTAVESRLTEMKKLLEEAHFAEIQEFAKNGDKSLASKKLVIFTQEHPNSKLSQDALWQALSLLFAEGKIFDGAELSLKYVEKYPEDKRNLDALREAAKSYGEVGQIQKSAETMRKMAELDAKGKNTHLEIAADIYMVDNKIPQARQTYREILSTASMKTMERIYGKILDSYKQDKNNPEKTQIKNQIVAKGVEPFATQIITEQARKHYEDGNYTAAFEFAMKANSRNVPAEIRAEARLIQSQILEHELIKQSVRAREEKFAIVMALKAEKLDKANTAYQAALKMSKDPFQQLEALRGIDRCYSNFIDSLTTMPLPITLTPAEQVTLREEIGKLITPIQEKKKENEDRLKTLAALKGQSPIIDRAIASIGADQTITPIATYPEESLFLPFFPGTADMTIGNVTRLEKTTPKRCTKKVIASITMTSTDAIEMSYNCFSSKQFELLEILGTDLAKNKETRPLGLLYASLAAEGVGNREKALWLIEVALRNSAEAAPLIYQKARLTYKAESLNTALPFFEKLLAMKLPSKEMKVFAGVRSFSEGDYARAIQLFSSLTKEQWYNFRIAPLIPEAYALNGEVEKALSEVKDLLNVQKENADLLIEQARLFEVFKGSPVLALESYERAYKSTRQLELRDWLGKKIQFLKTQNKVGQHVISEDL
jgi:TolA-binding protein